MKKTMNVTVLTIASVCAVLGIALCAYGVHIGGSFFRVMKNSHIMPSEDFHLELPYEEKHGNDSKNGDNGGMGGYGNGSYGNGGYGYDGGNSGSMDDIEEFFRQFGMDDNDINEFLNPFGGSDGAGEGRNGSDGSKGNAAPDKGSIF